MGGIAQLDTRGEGDRMDGTHREEGLGNAAEPRKGSASEEVRVEGLVEEDAFGFEPEGAEIPVDTDSDAPTSDDDLDPEADADAAEEQPMGGVRPAVAHAYGRRGFGKHAQPSRNADGVIPGLGVSPRTIALLCAVAVALSLLVSVVVSCSMQGAMQASLDAKYRDFESGMTEQFDAQKAEVAQLQERLGDDVQALATAQETSAEVEQAKAQLQSTVDDAKEWSKEGDGRWISDKTEDMLNNAIDVAERLIDETGVTDPQTYKQAEDSIQDIMDAVDEGRMW